MYNVNKGGIHAGVTRVVYCNRGASCQVDDGRSTLSRYCD